MRCLLRAQIIRFICVGILNTAFSYAVYAVLLYLRLDYRLANLGACVLGVIFGFRTQGTIVFHQNDPRRFLRFVLAWGTIYAVNISIIAGLIRTGLDAYSAGAVALVPVVGISYVLQRYWVFRAPAVDEEIR